MLYFVRDILPRIREVEPETTLSIIGRAPTPAVKRLAEGAGMLRGLFEGLLER